jgi:3-methyladenine DNA glycosylase AlkD
MKRDLKARADEGKAAFFPRFFKAGPGEYAEGDIFIGVTVPDVRAAAKAHRDMALSDLATLLADPVHEHRMAALEILTMQYEAGDEAVREKLVAFYLDHLEGVNNWDLVDGSAPYILGDWLLEHGDEKLLDTMAASKRLWTQRVAIVATYAFIKAGRLQPTFRLSEKLLTHTHDLMHKAVGWMLREAGKKDRAALDAFLEKHADVMPRTALRYALEKHEPAARKRFMAMKGLKARRSS